MKHVISFPEIQIDTSITELGEIQDKLDEIMRPFAQLATHPLIALPSPSLKDFLTEINDISNRIDLCKTRLRDMAHANGDVAVHEGREVIQSDSLSNDHLVP